jgi:hypothetical protein
MMKWFIICFAVVMFSLLQLVSCKHSTEPPIPLPDTTSHNFAWSIQYLGDGNSSVLHDVDIINDTLAYAVVELYQKDSTGQLDPYRYNYAAWNGTTWSVRRLPYYYQGQPYVNPIRSIFSFGSADIWFAGNGVSRWTESGFVEMPLPPSVWGGSGY